MTGTYNSDLGTVDENGGSGRKGRTADEGGQEKTKVSIVLNCQLSRDLNDFVCVRSQLL